MTELTFFYWKHLAYKLNSVIAEFYHHLDSTVMTRSVTIGKSHYSGLQSSNQNFKNFTRESHPSIKSHNSYFFVLCYCFFFFLSGLCWLPLPMTSQVKEVNILCDFWTPSMLLSFHCYKCEPFLLFLFSSGLGNPCWKKSLLELFLRQNKDLSNPSPKK